MKTKEELDALKNEVKDMNAKLAELNEDELKEVAGGVALGSEGKEGSTAFGFPILIGIP